MSLASRSGRAHVNLRAPQAQAVCDFCGVRYNHPHLSWQYEWGGSKLFNTGFLTCRRCASIPQDQFRSLILPGDPRPIANPRFDFYTTPTRLIGGPVPTSPENRGFSQYVLGGSYAPLYPSTKNMVLSAVASTSGVATPGLIFDRSTVIRGQDVSHQLMQLQPARTWLLLFNPTAAQAQVALGTAAVWGTNGFTTNLILGPGEAYFWSTAQGLAAAYTGSVSLVGQIPNLPFWAWESAGSTVLATDEWGNILTDENGAWLATDLPGPQTGFVFWSNGGLLSILPGGAGDWPPIDINLPPGAIWDNGWSVSVVGGAIPDPAAPAIYFGSSVFPSITPDELLNLGGGNLPLQPGAPGSGQLWLNNGGFPGYGGTVWIS